MSITSDMLIAINIVGDLYNMNIFWTIGIKGRERVIVIQFNSLIRVVNADLNVSIGKFKTKGSKEGIS